MAFMRSITLLSTRRGGRARLVASGMAVGMTAMGAPALILADEGKREEVRVVQESSVEETEGASDAQHLMSWGNIDDSTNDAMKEEANPEETKVIELSTEAAATTRQEKRAEPYLRGAIKQTRSSINSTYSRAMEKENAIADAYHAAIKTSASSIVSTSMAVAPYFTRGIGVLTASGVTYMLLSRVSVGKRFLGVGVVGCSTFAYLFPHVITGQVYRTANSHKTASDVLQSFADRINDWTYGNK